MSQEVDTKDRLTPMAFEPASCLLNLPLARPWRRGLAILADLTIISFFTTAFDSYFLLILILFWVYKTKWMQRFINQFNKLKIIMLRVFSFALLVFALLHNIQFILDKNAEGWQEGILPVLSTIGIASALIKGEDCQTADCWKPYIDDLLEGIAVNSPDGYDYNHLQEGIIDESALSEQEIIKFKNLFKNKMEAMNLKQLQSDESQAIAINLNTDNFKSSEEKVSSESSSTVSWLKGFLNDLGIGFGLSAIYFTFFVAWGHGQTPGKMLLNIQVIQLDNSSISLWEAFNRYGGYCAGLATGLLGFLQIYWDSNRQAIQDKIAATVVIDAGLNLEKSVES